MATEQEILKVLKVMVVRGEQFSSDPVVDHINRGLVLNFYPNNRQIAILKDFYKPLEIRTLFTRAERDFTDPLELISKQVLHYFEVYRLGTPGLFNLEISEGQILPMHYVRGVTEDELGDMVRELLYTNAPIKDSDVLKSIVEDYNIEFNVNRIANNELRVGLFNVDKHIFNDGDDAARYICYHATDNLMLIKSKEVKKAIAEKSIPVNFLEKHKVPLAQVFNRHKEIILAAKNKNTRTVINQISRMSKTHHIPVRSHISKRFVREALLNPKTYDYSVLDKISIRDKFKFLNLLEYKRMSLDRDTFIIRNGKIHVEPNRPIYRNSDIDRVTRAIMNSLADDLRHLHNKNILLDVNVTYGLPISRKQTIGQLPFGTQISVGASQICAGIYWQNDWGAHDLDLSTIDPEGNRTGWGIYSGYDPDNPITFSGDVTDATNGAMEFMTSKFATYGLFVHVYSGSIPCEMELVIGKTNKNQWIENPIIREKHTLHSNGNIVGFVRGCNFVVFSGRLGNSKISYGNQSIVAKGLSDMWTINNLFRNLNINFDLDRNEEKDYDVDLSYRDFSYDKLEKLLLE